MHNWWIASLEHFGLITHEEAEHIAQNIKNSIHKDNYSEAYRELEAILGDIKVETTPIVKALQNELDDLKAEVANIKEPLSANTPIGKATLDSETAPFPPPTAVKKPVANTNKA